MRYSSHMEPLAARTLASHYTVMRQRYTLAFQAALTTLAADLQAAIAPMLADPHFPALLEADQVATLQASDESGRRRAGFCATAACRCLRAPRPFSF